MKVDRKRLEHPAERYCTDILAGDIPASELVVLCCKRHREDLKRDDFVFDKPAATRVIRFFSFLRHSKGEWAGKPFELSPWQQFILWCLFGWKKKNGLRRFGTAYVEVPRKNGKSTFAAGVGLYLFFADGEPGAEVYCAATKRDQAKITHGEATNMVKRSPGLSDRIRVLRDNLSVEITSSKFEPLGADADTMDGLNIHGVIIDELHAHKTSAIVDVVETATGARRQPLVFEITTAGSNSNSICWDHHTYAHNILNGNYQDDAFFAYVAGIDPGAGDKPGDDWRDPKSWQKANPNWGISVKPENMEMLATKAKALPRAQNAFRRLRLDEWTGAETLWLDLELWDSVKMPVDPDELRGKRCYAGLDLSATNDLTALVLLFPPGQGAHCDDSGFRVVPFFFIPRNTMLERVKRDRVPYDIWAQSGFLEITPGNAVDYDHVTDCIFECNRKYDIVQIGGDPWNARQVFTDLGNQGVELLEISPAISQMSAPSKELERMILTGLLIHGGHPILRWNASNVVVRTDRNENYAPDKSRSTARIDGIVALIQAINLATRQGESETVYRDRGLRMIGG